MKTTNITESLENRNANFTLLLDSSSISFLKAELPISANNRANETESDKNRAIRTFLDIIKEHILGKVVEKLELPQIIVAEATGANAKGSPVDLIAHQQVAVKPVLRFLNDAFENKDPLIKIIPHPDDKTMLESRRKSAEIMAELKQLRSSREKSGSDIKTEEEQSLMREFKAYKKKSKNVGERRIKDLLDRDDTAYLVISDDSLMHHWQSHEIGNNGQREHAVITMNFAGLLAELDKAGILEKEGIDKKPEDIVMETVTAMNRRFSANNDMQTKIFEHAYPSRLKGSFADMIEASLENTAQKGKGARGNGF